MSSRIVAIKRRPNTTNIPANLYEESKKKIGSYFSEHGGTVGTGLTIEEEKKFMPRILGVAPTDITYNKQVQEYFANMTIDVPATGVNLEVGLDSDGEPLNLNDYIKWKFVQACPEVARSQEEMNSMKHLYFLYDPKLKLEADYEKLRNKKDAYKEFIKLSVNENKLLAVMAVCGIEAPSKLDTKTRELTMEKFVTENPGRFMEVLADSNLEMKAFILDCIRTGILQRIGTAILNGDQRLGGTMEEAIEKLKDKTESETLTVLKARLQEYNK